MFQGTNFETVVILRKSIAGNSRKCGNFSDMWPPYFGLKIIKLYFSYLSIFSDHKTS